MLEFYPSPGNGHHQGLMHHVQDGAVDHHHPHHHLPHLHHLHHHHHLHQHHQTRRDDQQQPTTGNANAQTVDTIINHSSTPLIANPAMGCDTGPSGHTGKEKAQAAPIYRVCVGL